MGRVSLIVRVPAESAGAHHAWHLQYLPRGVGAASYILTLCIYAYVGRQYTVSAGKISLLY